MRARSIQPSVSSWRRLGAALLLSAAAALGVSACGGDNDPGAQDVLNTAFSKSVKSADLALEAQLKLRGGSAGPGLLRITARGPYRDNPGKLPSVDLDLSVSPGSGGQSISTGFLSTGDRAFVKFQDAFYEQPKAQVEQTNRALATRRGRRGSLKALGLDPRSWLRNAKKEGDEDVAGVKSTHVSGQLDVKKVLRDFNDVLRKSGGALGAAGGATPPRPLSDAEIGKVAQVVKNPSFDVYVGKDDKIVRRVAGRLEFEVPQRARANLRGLQGGSLQFSVQLSKVGGDQRIEAPANARPLSDLTKTLGGAGLGGITGGATGGAAPGATTTPSQPTAPPSGGSAAPPSGGAGSPTAEAFARYSKCLDKAKPSDRQALQRCAAELRK